jgi:hypothetical protein
MLPYLECDGCLILGDDKELIEIADFMEFAGRKVWPELSDVPKE